MASNFLSDLLGTLKSTFRINLATVSASGLSAARTFTLPDRAGTIGVTGETKRIPIIGWQVLPDTTGDCFFEPYSVKATNDVWPRMVAVLNDTSTRIGLYGGFKVPKDYASNAKIIITWTSTATSGNAVFDFDYRAVSGNDSESLDQSGNQESVSVTDAAPGAAHRKLDASVNLTSANLAADDEVTYGFFRDGTDGSESLGAAVIVFSLEFEYTT